MESRDQEFSQRQNSETNTDLAAEQSDTALASKLESEAKKLKPPVKIFLYFATHDFDQNFENIQEPFQEADLYIPEVPGWNADILKDWQSVSDGTTVPEDVSTEPKNSARRYELRLLHNSHKTVAMVDLPQNSVITNLYKQTVVFEQQAFSGGRFSKILPSEKEVMTYVNQWIKKMAEYGAAREQYITDHFIENVQAVIAQTEKLQKKKSLAAVMNLGSAHSGVSRLIEQQGLETSRSFPSNHYGYNFFNQAIRIYRFGVIPPAVDMPDSLAKKIWMEYYLGRNLDLDRRDEVEYGRNIESITKQFSDEDFDTLFEARYSYLSGMDTFHQTIKSLLRQKHIDVPIIESFQF